MKRSGKSLSGWLIAFDLDDTLISEREYLTSVFKVFAGRGYASLPALLEYDNAYKAIDEIIDERFRESAVTLYRSGEIPTRPVSGTESLLKDLSERGAVLAVITDGWSGRQRGKLAGAGLTGYFSFICISEENGNKDKLTGEPFRLVDEHYPSLKKVYVGDNPAKDFVRAKERGWKTVMVRNPELRYVHPAETFPEEYAADIVLDSLEKVTTVLFD